MFLKFVLYTLVVLSSFFAWTEPPRVNVEQLKTEPPRVSVEQLKKDKDIQMAVAINNGNLERVKELLASGEYDDVLSASDENTVNRATYLRNAVRTGNTDMIQVFLDKGINVNAKGKWGRAALHEAPTAESIKMLLAVGADVNITSDSGSTPLHTVHTAEDAEILINAGAFVNARDEMGETPLYGVASRELAELYVSKGGDLNNRDKQGRTPLHRVQSIEAAEVYIRAGGNMAVEDAWGRTPQNANIYVAAALEKISKERVANTENVASCEYDNEPVQVITCKNRLTEGERTLCISQARCVVNLGLIPNRLAITHEYPAACPVLANKECPSAIDCVSDDTEEFFFEGSKETQEKTSEPFLVSPESVRRIKNKGTQ